MHAATEDRRDRGYEAGFSKAVSYLRTFITILVVTHHAGVAYSTGSLRIPFSTLREGLFAWPFAPVVDDRTTPAAIAVIAFTEISLMNAMFLLSGLFVDASLRAKGAARFVRDRLVRLGIPFFVIIGVIGPLAYATAFLRTTGEAHTLPHFWAQWRALGIWPVGPAWFLWVLLAFDLATAAALRDAPVQRLTPMIRWLRDRPIASCILFTASMAVMYVPAGVFLDALAWRAWGPFAFQESRMPAYAWIFLLGWVLGAVRHEVDLLAADGPIVKHWWLWLLYAAVGYALVLAILPTAIPNYPWSWKWRLLGSSIAALASSAYILALITGFLHLRPKRRALFDWLSANAFGIYIVHYALVAWSQYFLRPVPLPALAKFAIVATTGIFLSGALTSLARRSAVIRRIF